MTEARRPAGEGRVAAAVRVNGVLRSVPTDFTADSIFPIYSITKTLTAICVLRLAETGSLRLAAPARDWLPDVNIPGTTASKGKLSIPFLREHGFEIRMSGYQVAMQRPATKT